MLGGSAMPTAWKATPTSPVTGVRRMKRLPSCSVSISWRRSRFMSKAPHSDFNRAAARWSSSRLRRTSDERQKRAKDVAADCGVLLMIDRPGGENGFCRSEDVLHLEQLAISQHGGERAQGGVGAQHVEAVISGVVRDPLVV